MSYLFSVILGMVFWTFMEYMLHRFLGHEWLWRNKFRKEHQKHHHLKDYFTSNFDKVLTSVVFGSLTFGLAHFIVGFKLSCIFTTSFICMYLIYEFLHRSCHINAPKNDYEAFIRRHHFYHHFENEMVNHGVTSPIWDILFGTYEKATLVSVNKRFVMRWLCEEGTSRVKQAFENQYRIVESTKYT